METEYYFTDKDRDYRTYHTIADDNYMYSKILFHKVLWRVCDHSDITKLQDSWAEEIMQGIIDGQHSGSFEVIFDLENDNEETAWLEWEIMNIWDGWS